MDEQQRRSLGEGEKAARVDLLRANVRQAGGCTNAKCGSAATVLFNSVPGRRCLGWTMPRARGKLRMQVAACPGATECMQQALPGARITAPRRPRSRPPKCRECAPPARATNPRFPRRRRGARWMPDPSDQPDAADDLADVGRGRLAGGSALFDGRLTRAKVAGAKGRASAQAQGACGSWNCRFALKWRRPCRTSPPRASRPDGRARPSGQADESFRVMQEKLRPGQGHNDGCAGR